MLWPDVEERARAHVADGMSVADAIGAAADSVTAEQVRIIAIPRRFSEPMREVWALQLLLEHGSMDNLDELIQSRRFRAAYDFLLLRASIDNVLQPLADWWTEIQRSHNEVREELIANKPVIEGYWGESPEQLENLTVPVPPSNDRKNPRDRNRKPRQRRGKQANSNNGSGDEADKSVEKSADSSASDKPRSNSRHNKNGNDRNNSNDDRGNRRGNRSNNKDNVGNRQKPASRGRPPGHENWDDDNRGNRAIPEESEDTYTIYDEVQPEHNANRAASELLGVQGQTRQRGGRHRSQGNNSGQSRQRHSGGNSNRSGSGQSRGKKRSARRRPDNAQAANGDNHQQGASSKKTSAKKGGGQGMNGQRRRRSRNRRPSSGGSETAASSDGGTDS